MKILMVSAEYAPLAKTGGLADAVAGLAGSLQGRGHDVRVLLPRYPQPLPAGWTAHAAGSAEGLSYFELRDGDVGARVFAVSVPEIDAGDALYTGDERDATRFMGLSRGALHAGEALGWQPDVVHCHDWHAALVTAMLRAPGTIGASDALGAARPMPTPSGAPGASDEPRARVAADSPRTVLTLHNIGYQGWFPFDVLERNGFGPLAAFVDDDDRAHGGANLLKIGIRSADAITTVSPTYAREILSSPDYGMGLEQVLQERRQSLIGILNGVDYSLWGPETDPFIEPRYGREQPEGKRLVKAALCRDAGLSADAPLIGVVTRLVVQKGIDLLVDALPSLLEATDAKFVLLGSGEASLEAALKDAAARYPERISFTRGYDEALAHRILAGSDIVLVPSRYEPCGLTQMYALRYGTIPVVRATGGLADTIRHFDAVAGTGNGSVFEHADAQGLIWGLTTALGWYTAPDVWRLLMDNAMREDFSWARQAEPYEALYRRLLSSPRAIASAAGAAPADR